MRTPRGEVFLPIRIEGSTSAEFLANRAAFRKSLDGSKENTLRITRPDGEWREIKCRYVSGGRVTMEPDPVLVRRATYGLTFATGDPFWRGQPVTVRFPYAPPQLFFNAWPPVVNSAETLGSATVTNLGDVPSAAVWHMDGPFTAFSVGVGDALVAMTVTKTLGQWVEVDARPGVLTMLDETGTRMWSYATKENLTGMAVPPGESVGLSTVLTGASYGAGVSVTFEPGYRDGY